MAKNVTLKDENDEVIYPETKTENIFHGSKKLKDELDNMPRLDAKNTFKDEQYFKDMLTVYGEARFEDKLIVNSAAGIKLEEGGVTFADGTEMDSAPHLYRYVIKYIIRDTSAIDGQDINILVDIPEELNTELGHYDEVEMGTIIKKYYGSGAIPCSYCVRGPGFDYIVAYVYFLSYAPTLVGYDVGSTLAYRTHGTDFSGDVRLVKKLF